MAVSVSEPCDVIRVDLIGVHEPLYAGNASGVGTTAVQQISTPHTVNSYHKHSESTLNTCILTPWVKIPKQTNDY